METERQNEAFKILIKNISNNDKEDKLLANSA